APDGGIPHHPARIRRMNRTLPAATLVALLLGIAWLGWRGRGEHPAAYQAVAPSAAPSIGPDEGRGPMAASPADRLVIASNDAGSNASNDARRGGTVTVRGRCIEEGSGTALPACTVDIHGWGSNAART